MIDLLPNEDQEMLIESFRDVLAAEAPLARLRTQSGDRELIGKLAQLGWIGLAVPEAQGGIGLGPAEQILLFRETGRQLVGPGLLATVIAAELAAEKGDVDLLAQVLDGDVQIALATADGQHRLDHAPGVPTLHVDAQAAMLLEEQAFGGASVVDSLDPSVRVERVELDAADARMTGRDAQYGLNRSLFVAAQLVGLAEAVRDMATAYAKERQQFGQPIGAFQAIKHRCADMAVGCEAAWSLTVFAALAVAERRADAAFQVAAAYIVAAEAALAAVRGNIQIHGGIGFAEECDAQMFVKRCHLLIAIGDTVRSHKASLIAQPEPVKSV